ncbi:hypothetical protein EC9_04540 [Rosistilla ulvae]|uniref:Uncharacterized protein n=1 Tax=Rosistilla ulvae TaxID=1930277 RepID=A0A517LUK2_9BACT|nr:hypothetical protein EC9_04540 [Rosistilla ulvae]
MNSPTAIGQTDRKFLRSNNNQKRTQRKEPSPASTQCPIPKTLCTQEKLTGVAPRQRDRAMASRSGLQAIYEISKRSRKEWQFGPVVGSPHIGPTPQSKDEPHSAALQGPACPPLTPSTPPNRPLQRCCKRCAGWLPLMPLARLALVPLPTRFTNGEVRCAQEDMSAVVAKSCLVWRRNRDDGGALISWLAVR